jgi:hypothetical protein
MTNNYPCWLSRQLLSTCLGFTPGEARGRAEEMLSLSGVSKGSGT